MLSKYASYIDTKTKKIILIAVDIIILITSIFLSFSLRLSKIWYIDSNTPMTIWLGPIYSLFFLYIFNVYDSVVSIYSKKTEKRILYAQTVAALLWGFSLMVFGAQGFPRSVIFIYWMLTVISLVGWRRLLAFLLSGRLPPTYSSGAKSVVIFGAGKQGAELAELLEQGRQMRPIAFVDINERYVGRWVAGLKVFHMNDLPALLEAQEIHAVLLSTTRIPRHVKVSLLETLKPHGVELQVIPSPHEIAAGEVQVNHIRPFKLEDLLPRPPVPPRKELMQKAIAGKSVLVTGAGGSIGSELVRQALAYAPRELIMLDNSEYNLFTIMKEVEESAKQRGIPVHAVLGSVVDKQTLNRIFAAFDVDVVFHAAAYKHVHLCEENPVPAIRNNIFGTLYTLERAQAAGVRRFVLISTDKAVHPKSVMGATKRVAEMIIQTRCEEGGGMLCTAVRFGNVLGSSGSVVPIFKAQIAKGGPVTVTHPKATRYFMLISEAAQLVIQAAAITRGREVFLLKMAGAVSILELAKTMIRLSGFVPRIEGKGEGDIDIIFTGLKKGEKLYEELYMGKAMTSTEHDRILLCEEDVPEKQALEAFLGKLEKLLNEGKDAEAVEILMKFVGGRQQQGEQLQAEFKGNAGQ